MINKILNLYKIINGSVIAVMIMSAPAYSQDAGSRAAFTRGGWAGAKYVAMGMAAEVVVDDVYSIYWNPAGLSELKTKKRLTENQIKDRAKSGDVDGISEDDLLNFTEVDQYRPVLQVGVSAALLDVEREAGFVGIAFDAFNGVIGIGNYAIISTGIEERDDSGNLIGKNLNYIASVSFFSFGWAFGVSTCGVSIKGLYEKIGDVTYGGFGADMGIQLYFLPFLKLGFVMQDLGTGLIPTKSSADIERKYDLAAPSFKVGGSISSDTGVTISVTGVKRFEQDAFKINFGLQYDLLKSTEIYLGMNDKNFTTGITFKFYDMSLSYAFTVDKINLGYNNIVSATALF